MSKARRKNTPVIPSTIVFDIPELYQQTLSSKRFLLIDLYLFHFRSYVLHYLYFSL